MNALALLDDRWIPYCNSPTPSIPSDIPVSLLVPIIVCGAFASLLLATFVRHAILHTHPVTPEEFEEANERIIVHMPLLKMRRGEDLRWLCRAISRDLLRVTEFVTDDVTGCIRKYHSGLSRGHGPLAPMIALIGENVMLRRNAIQIEILYHVKPLTSFMVRQTNEAVTIFSTRWLMRLEQYCLENLRHEQL
jgi:hypothetical protein